MSQEGCLSGHYWSGGVCSLCGERLRCGACHCFVTIDNLSAHIENDCPVREDAHAAAPSQEGEE